MDRQAAPSKQADGGSRLRRAARKKAGTIACAGLTHTDPIPAPAGLLPAAGLAFRRQETFALRAFAGELAGAANGLGLFACTLFGWLFVLIPELHLTEDTLTLHFLLQRLKGLIDIVIANENLHAYPYPFVEQSLTAIEV